MSKNLISKLIAADEAYFNKSKPIMSDAAYDRLKNQVREKHSTHPYFKTIGATPGSKKTKLPVQMQSLDKLRPNEVAEWVNARMLSGGFVLLPKLDGVSLLLHYHDGKLVAAYSRGNGVLGKKLKLANVKHIQGVIKNIDVDGGATNQWFPYSGDVYVRCEVIIHKKLFNKYIKDYRFTNTSTEYYKNTRNFCSGMINIEKNADNYEDIAYGLKYTTAVAHNMTRHVKSKEVDYKFYSNKLTALGAWGFTHILNPSRYNKKSIKDLKKIQDRHGVMFKGVLPIKHYDYVDNQFMVDVTGFKSNPENYISARIKSLQDRLDIDQDGLVLTINDLYLWDKRKNKKFPSHAIAIKPDIIDQEQKIGVVKRIVSEMSPRQIYVPVIVLEQPLFLSGADVTRITLHHYSNVLEKGIGPGAKISVVRSGGVIPHVAKVIKKADIKLPVNCRHCDTKLSWTKTKVDLFCPNKNCNGVGIENLNRFFSKIFKETKIGMARSTIENMAKAGINTIPKVLRVTTKDLVKLDGLAEKKAKNIVDGIKKATSNMNLAMLMDASGLFSSVNAGMGTKRLESIVEAIGKKSILAGDYEKWRTKLYSIPGIGGTLVNQFIRALNDFRVFYKEIETLVSLGETQLSSSKLAGQVFAFTGFRSAELVKFIKENGGAANENFTSKTTVLFAATESDKTRKAKSKGVKIVDAKNAEKFLKGMCE